MLRPLKNGVANPEISTDNILWSTLANNLESAKKQLQSMEGTLLEQEESRMFAYADKNELAAKVMRGYSTLADFVQGKAEEGFQQEHGRRWNMDSIRVLGKLKLYAKELLRKYLVKNYHPLHHLFLLG